MVCAGYPHRGRRRPPVRRDRRRHHGHLTLRTLAQVCAETLQRLPADFVTPASRAGWAARELPWPASISAFAWECRLGSETGTDLQSSIDARAVAEVDPASVPGPWRVATEFTQHWARSRLPGGLFLEADEPTAGGPLQPLIFPRIDIENHGAWSMAAGFCVHRLSDAKVPPAFLGALNRAVQALPEGGAPLYVGWMGTRPVPHIRFIATVPVAGVSTFLERLRWPGDAAAVQAIVESYAQGSSEVPIGLDVGEALGPTLGVELHWSGPPSPGDRTDRLLDVLRNWPEIDPSRVEAARRWRSPQAAVDFGPRLQVKLGFRDGRRSAKAYLGAWTEGDVGS